MDIASECFWRVGHGIVMFYNQSCRIISIFVLYAFIALTKIKAKLGGRKKG